MKKYIKYFISIYIILLLTSCTYERSEPKMSSQGGDLIGGGGFAKDASNHLFLAKNTLLAQLENYQDILSHISESEKLSMNLNEKDLNKIKSLVSNVEVDISKGFTETRYGIPLIFNYTRNPDHIYATGYFVTRHLDDNEFYKEKPGSQLYITSNLIRTQRELLHESSHLLGIGHKSELDDEQSMIWSTLFLQKLNTFHMSCVEQTSASKSSETKIIDVNLLNGMGYIGTIDLSSKNSLIFELDSSTTSYLDNNLVPNSEEIAELLYQAISNLNNNQNIIESNCKSNELESPMHYKYFGIPKFSEETITFTVAKSNNNLEFQGLSEDIEVNEINVKDNLNINKNYKFNELMIDDFKTNVILRTISVDLKNMTLDYNLKYSVGIVEHQRKSKFDCKWLK